MTKNEIYETEITGMTAEGSGVCRIDGMAVFVPMTAIGDKLKVRIVKVLKSYAFGIIEELLDGSPERCEPDCSVFRQCGGCTFRHVNYQEELHYKEQFVHDVFERIGGLHPEFAPILACEERDGYRNKAQYPVAEVNGHLVCGFYARHSHRVIPFTKCRLQPEIFTQMLEFLLPWLESCGIIAYDEKNHSGELRHIYLRRGFHSGEIMLCLISRISIRKKLQKHIPELLQKFPQIVSVSESINPDKTNVIMGKSVSVLMGQNHITDTMCNCRIAISPQSFYQVNTKQAEKMYMIAKKYAQLSGTETLLDL
ncbi:MAG TPA: 23S rRNA (uracil(1939)-C(5))-methyltransferase RlmD, partial [Ruminococcus sp.]|nr:23S rRNA (uracil(1939)-C(5))-methyltransferase RlmD [Ruminococcus sp.]